MKKTLLVLACLGLTTALASAKVVIKGSDTIGASLMPQWAEIYKKSHPNFDFEIAAEGSTTGFAALIDKKCDIAMASRRAKTAEMAAAGANGVNMKPIICAYDGIGLIVNAGAPIQALTKDQIASIFAGDVTDWSQVSGSGMTGPISVYTRNTSSGTYAEFRQMAMNNKEYAGTSRKMAGNEQIAAEVANNKNGIGYVGLAYVNKPGIKTVTVNGIPLTPANVKSKTYPISRGLFLYVDGTPSGEAKEFIDWCLSSEGASVVSRVGFVPIN